MQLLFNFAPGLPLAVHLELLLTRRALQKCEQF